MSRPPTSRPTRSRPTLAALVALLVAALSAAGCVSMPSGGPALSYPVTQGTGAQNQPYVQIVPQPPGAGWSPKQIVQGFLTASASFGNYGDVALQYLTPQEHQTWAPKWSAIVYKSAPIPTNPVYPSPTAKNPTTATVQITGSRQAILQGYGSYSLPSSSAPAQSYAPPPSFTLVKVGGQWRISGAPDELLLSSDSFANDYQLYNLYFFDPTYRFLVPDPVYVPVRAKPGDLLNGLVYDLITPLKDWLSAGATKTALPPGTKISDVTLDGVTAIVNLTGTITKAKTEVMQLVSAQLLWTLAGGAQSGATGQAVQSVEVEVNGKPWAPPGSQGNPVQRPSDKSSPPLGASPAFYYVDGSGYLTSRAGAGGKPVSLGKIGTGYSQIAVSPDGMYVAALRGSTLYTGLADGTLAVRGTGYVAMSWDVNDNLWASTGAGVVMFRNVAKQRQPLEQKAAVDVVYGNLRNLSPQFTALRVAPDGVRMAIVIGQSELTFGAISGQQGASPQITLSTVQLSPVSPATTFTGLSWYGPDNVITLADPGPTVTEYPVSGGTPTPIPADSEMQSISASYKLPLIAGGPKGKMVADASLTGSWMTIDGLGSAPTYPG
ncbi:MAG: LpqB family beta-propeller domain-containing protein [Trebonia sp.]